jgi:superfamily I DNA/RNA helicase
MLEPTEEQKTIIAHRTGPAMILATAGSAKTTTLILWAKELLASSPGLSCADVLLTTFSRLGISDLRRRAGELGLHRLPDVRTLHSLAWKAIKAKHPNWKLPPEWWVRQIVKDIFDRSVEAAEQAYVPDDDGNWHDDREGSVAGVRFNMKAVTQLISKAKANLILPDAWTDALGERHPGFAEWAESVYTEPTLTSVAEQCYRVYEAARQDPLSAKSKLKEFRPGDIACSHDDALLEVARAILNQADWVRHLEGSFRYVVCDEAQDLNLAQWILVRHVARRFKSTTQDGVESSWQNLIATGDDCQAIYSWRGARPDLLRDMMLREGPSLSFYPLTTNFRSGLAILDAANNLLGAVKHRLFGGMLRCGRPDIEAEITTLAAGNAVIEATAVVDAIQKALREGRKPSEIAILYRINAQSGLVEMELIRRGVPYRVAGRCFFMRPEIDAAIKYIALAMNEEDEEAFETIYRLPFRFIGRGLLREFPTLAKLRTPPRGQLAAKFKGAPRLIRDMDGLIARLKDEGLVAALEYVFDVIGVRRYCKTQADEEDQDEFAEAHASQVDTAIEELLACARVAGDPVRFVEFVRDQREKVMVEDGDGDKSPDDRVTLSTAHRCVDETTLIETLDGLTEIRNAADSGVIGTPEGAKRYNSMVRYPGADMLRIVTKSGYEVVVTPNHGMMAWDGFQYSRHEASDLKVGQFVRLVLRPGVEPVSPPTLPPEPPRDVRATAYRIPDRLTGDLAEFFGLMVGDGTLYKTGFRLSKRHREVADRFGELGAKVFGCTPSSRLGPLRAPRRNLSGDHLYISEFSSTFIADWLRSVGGMSPNAKAIPACVMAAPSAIQARFLSGLFEDGTVNARAGKLDHFDWSNASREVVRVVQVMLLRHGIISSRRPVAKKTGAQWHLYVYGRNAALLSEKIGLISKVKRDRLALPHGNEDMYSVPLAKELVMRSFPRSTSLYARQNGLFQGYLSRHTLREAGGFDAELSFHHDRVARIEPCRGVPMCVSVPSLGRFTQNGFDGCNSKGLQFEEVFVIGISAGLFPFRGAPPDEEKRLGYVAITRAKRLLHLSWTERPSSILYDAGLLERPVDQTGAIDDIVRLEI